MGRHTTHTEEMDELALAYLAGGYREQEPPHMVPSVLGMAKVLKVSRPTLYSWSDDDRGQFADILQACNEATEFATINGALGNVLNSNIAKLLLGKFGYADKQETDLNANLGMAQFTGDQLDARIQALTNATEQG